MEKYKAMTYRGRIGWQGMISYDQIVVFSAAALPLQCNVQELIDKSCRPLPDDRAQQASGQSSVMSEKHDKGFAKTRQTKKSSFVYITIRQVRRKDLSAYTPIPGTWKHLSELL